jgi:hypothetical protein
MNCEDPDCQAHVHCAAIAARPIGHSSPPRKARDPRVSGPADARVIEPADGAPSADEDGGDPSSPVSDGGAAPCGGLCDAADCIDDMCRDPGAPSASAFELRILTVEVPDFDQSGTCLDTCVGSLLPPFGFCACAPDPYVEVWRERGDGDPPERVQVGSTTVAPNERDPDFMDEPMSIELLPGDALEFVVLDDDPGPGPGTPVYACRPELDALASAELACSAEVVSFLPPYSITAELHPLP